MSPVDRRRALLCYALVTLCVASACSSTDGQRDARPLAKDGAVVDVKGVLDGPGVPRQLSLIATRDLSAELLQGRLVGRPDAVIIGDTIYLTFTAQAESFYLKRFDADASLTPRGVAEPLYSGERAGAIDIRVASDADGIWYAFEDFTGARAPCGEHFLNAARYRILPALELDMMVGDLATGCVTTLPEAFSVDPSIVPAEPEAVDDPTPLYWRGSHYILTRAWSGWIPEHTHNTTHKVRRLNEDFELAETKTLDLSGVFSDRTLSQNALVVIEGVPHLIGGFYTERRIDQPQSRSGVYAVPLADDLASIAGATVPLIVDDRWVFKSTSAVVADGKLYVNYQMFAEGTSSQRFAAFDVTRQFAKLADEELHTAPTGTVMANHSSVVAKGGLVFAFYPKGGGAIEAKLFSWR